MDETHYINSDANPRESSAIMWTNQIQSLNPEEFMHLLSQLEDMWDINTTNNSMISFQLGYKNFINTQQNLNVLVIDVSEIDFVNNQEDYQYIISKIRNGSS